MTVKVNGQHIGDSPFAVQVTPFQFKPVLSFGKKGSSEGMFSFSWGVAVNARDEIAVTDHNNHRVQIFNSEGNYLRSFGRHGNKEGEFQSPIGITYHNKEIFSWQTLGTIESRSSVGWVSTWEPLVGEEDLIVSSKIPVVYRQTVMGISLSLIQVTD